jgi:LAO/AO transport system kinase
MKSNLNIQKGGTPMPSAINGHFVRKKRPELSVEEYVAAILSGDRVRLSQAITLVESNHAAHQKTAQTLVNACLPHAGRSIRIGITGTPGVGKSTFIEAMGEYVTGLGHRLAVLTIDPSSQISHGSILGDKTRMELLSNNPNAFIRPSAAGASLGGVAHKTRETIILCEAAGFDVIFVETVGVGQSEVTVHSMVDFFLLLLLPNAGDELQGIKRGVVEMADLIAINKADGENADKAKIARNAYRNGLHLFPPKSSGWTATAVTCSALANTGISEIWQHFQRFQQLTLRNGYFQKHRQAQAQHWLNDRIAQELRYRFEANAAVQTQLGTVRQQVLDGEITPSVGADLLLRLFLGDI